MVRREAAQRPDSTLMPDGYRRVSPAPILNAANAVTLARICAVPVAIWLVLHRHWEWAFGVSAVAGLSDALDGWLARRQGPTVLGAMLDPLADKAMVAGLFITLAVVDRLPDWIAMLVVFRDIAILGGIGLLRAAGSPAPIRALPISKLNTALQLTLVAVALGLPAFGIEAPGVVFALVVAVAAGSVASGAAYVARLAG